MCFSGHRSGAQHSGKNVVVYVSTGCDHSHALPGQLFFVLKSSGQGGGTGALATL